MLSSGQESQVPGKKQIILNFVEGSQGVIEEAAEVAVYPAAAFGDVAGTEMPREAAGP